MRRGQLESGELILVMIFVVILLVIGLSVYTGMKTQGIQETQREFDSLAATEKLADISNFLMIQCSHTAESQNCIDLHRLNATSKLMQPPTDGDVERYMRQLFGYMNVTVTGLYGLDGIAPWNESEWLCVQNDDVDPDDQDGDGSAEANCVSEPPGGLIDQKRPERWRWKLYENFPEDYTSKKQFVMPVNLYDPLTKTMHFGVITMEVYS